MLCASSGCDSSSIWCPSTPPPTFNSAVINGWLADQPVSPRPPHSDRKHAYSPFLQALQPKRCQPLQPTHANINRCLPRRKDNTEQLSPNRKAQGSEHDVLLDEGYVEENDVLGDIATTLKPSRVRKCGLIQRPLDLAAFSATYGPDSIASSSLYTNALAHYPVLHLSNTNSSSSSIQSGKSKSKRAMSLAKTYSDLQLLNKPVKYGVMDVERDDLPEDIRVLIEDLQTLCENVGIIPSKMQDRIASAKKRSYWTYETGRDEIDLMIELDMIRRVQAAAVSLSSTGDHEPQWYCSVQWPLLDVAFRHMSHIEPKQISHALPIKECLPQTGERYSESRLVDFAINLIPQSVSDDSLSEWLRSQPKNLRTVNQSLYAPLCRHPTMISIEVEVNGTEEEAWVQIGIWLSAWHERVGQIGANQGHWVITLPVIIVLNHYWYLYLVVDKGLYIEILQFTESIGDTLSLVKVYRILAVLRRLGEWGLETFEPWFKAKLFDLL
ncbi:hypothetical protein P154DRAFT_471486 [Amniculicola lignicola CBS 123094]|uniref:PD-(D/E)XK nuclease-like domain-containing protein n=1 Tax=Amniculicola lignicola CBS 123094 TaxID=1392246 RepID=A0A6A5WD73_9PLEO|nr:hypothetical protein P154DRAFT_471486 [Amniculicola lignicola CBS 123094]